MDNYYNGVDLAHKLLEKKNILHRNTSKQSKKKILLTLLKYKVNTGESISKYTKYGVCVIKWKDRREVLTISSEYNGELIEETNIHGNVKLKPNQIVQYNKFMSGVDRQDQMMAYYPCERKTLSCYKKIGIHFIQICMLNSYLIYIKNIKKISYYDYRLSVIHSLLSFKSNTPSSQVPILIRPENLPRAPTRGGGSGGPMVLGPGLSRGPASVPG